MSREMFEPEFPCRLMITRSCPEVYEGVCGDRPCARYESDDETPWLDEVRADNLMRRLREYRDGGPR